MKKTFFLAIPFLYLLLLGITPIDVLAAAEKKPVLFRVDVGNLVCTNGAGAASVLFSTEPKEGGYYEIIGGAINQNSMTLDRRVILKSGTYTWKGAVNEGYYEIPPSLGEFTIPDCGASSTVPVVQSSPEKEAQKKDIGGDISDNSLNTATTSPMASGAEETNTKESASPNTTAVVVGLVAVGFLVGSVIWRNVRQKNGEAGKNKNI